MLPFLSLFLNLVYFSLKLAGISSFPRPLTAEEEARYLKRMAEGDESARAKLIEHNLRLVAHIIKKYYAAAKDHDDLISIGTIGLIKAINSFDASKNTRLATYAARCVENEIFMYFRTLRRQSCEVSLSDPIDTDSDGNNLELMDVLSEEEDMLETLVKSDRIARLRHYIETALDERERQIINLRYGLTSSRPLTQRELAERLNISRSYVSRIEKKALEKIKKLWMEGA